MCSDLYRMTVLYVYNKYGILVYTMYSPTKWLKYNINTNMERSNAFTKSELELVFNEWPMRFPKGLNRCWDLYRLLCCYSSLLWTSVFSASTQVGVGSSFADVGCTSVGPCTTHDHIHILMCICIYTTSMYILVSCL